jgi:hypothetical protein
MVAHTSPRALRHVPGVSNRCLGRDQDCPNALFGHCGKRVIQITEATRLKSLKLHSPLVGAPLLHAGALGWPRSRGLQQR